MKHKFFKLMPDLLLTIVLVIGFKLSPAYGVLSLVVWLYIALDGKSKRRIKHSEPETIIIEEPEAWDC